MTRPEFPETPIPDDGTGGILRDLMPNLDYVKLRGMGRPCEATAIFYGPDSAHIKSEEIRGMCDYEARAFREGRPVCVRHLTAKTVVWCHEEPHVPGSVVEGWR